jgi:hypothetical protein
LLYALHASDRVTPRELFEEHFDWARSHGACDCGAGAASGSTRDPERRLRVGYVSPDFAIIRSRGFFVRSSSIATARVRGRLLQRVTSRRSSRRMVARA